MKRYIILSLILLSFNSFAISKEDEEALKLTGTVVDAVNQAAVEYSSVAILDQDGKVVNGTLTDDNGNFEISNLKKGSYSILISFMGYKNYQSKLDFNKSLNLGIVKLEPSIEALDAVEVTAERSTYENRLDKKVITVGKDLVSTGTTASDIMDNIPSISKDENGKIMLRGNQNIRVLVNGKPTNIKTEQILKQIPSSSIDKIEVITNPSAKYSAENEAGIINIILKKQDMQGFNINVNSGVSNYFDSWKLDRINSGVDVNYKYNKLNVFASYNYQKEDMFFSGYQNQIKYFQNYVEAGIRDANADAQEQGDIAKLGFDYNISDREVISYKTTFSFYKNSFLSKVNYKSFDDISKQNLIYQIDSEDLTVLKPTTYEHNLNYRYNFDLENKNYLEVDAFYSVNSSTVFSNISRNIDPIAANPGFLTKQQDNSVGENKQYILSLDYTNSAMNFASIESGLRYERRNNFDEYNYAVNESVISGFNPSNRFDFDENIYAGYFVAKKNLGRFDVNLGLRAEYTTIDGILGQGSSSESKVVDQDYLDLFPTAHLSYKLNKEGTSSLLLSYSRRIQRPSLWNMNPTIKLSENFAETGNTDLKPQYTNSFELGYSLYKNKFNLNASTYFRMTENAWSLYVQSDTTLTYVMQKNAASSKVGGLELSGMYNFAKWYRMNLSADINYSVMDGGNGIETNEGLSYSIRMMNNFKLAKGTSTNLNVLYFGPAYLSQGVVDPRYMVNVGVRQELFKGKASLSLNVNDIFGTMKSEYVVDTKAYDMFGNNKWSSRMITLNFTYSFGDVKIKTRSLRAKPKNQGSKGGGL